MVMCDLIFEEYSLEEEDYMTLLEGPEMMQDRETIELLGGIEKGVVELLKNIGLLNQNQMN